MRIVLLLSWLLFSFSVFATKIEESYFVHSNSPSLKKIITQNPRLILDHPSKKGFEVYGPKGLGEYLKSINVKFSNLDLVESVQKKSNQFSYPRYEQVVKRLQNAVAKYSKFMKIFSVGKTVKGRDLWVVKISDNVNVDEAEPEFKYISSMHGDEIVGRELMQIFIEDLGAAYVAGDKEVTKLINDTEIFIMPSMNPDGSEIPQRGNGNNVDLNRNFPNPFVANKTNIQNRGRIFQGGRTFSMMESGLEERIEPETQAIMKFHEERNFSLSANFHGGAVVMNYPWDSIYERHPLNDFLIDISLDYSKLNAPMWNSTEFERGITNGADWYIVRGGMQDWSYVVHNDLQFTVELSDIKYPNFAEIPKFYKDNRESLLSFMQYIYQGAGFQWQNKKNESGLVEVLTSSGSTLGKFPWKNGEFYKVLPVGNYTYVIYGKQGSLLKKLPVEVVAVDKINISKI
jgi:hypothetical protein